MDIPGSVVELGLQRSAGNVEVVQLRRMANAAISDKRYSLLERLAITVECVVANVLSIVYCHSSHCTPTRSSFYSLLACRSILPSLILPSPLVLARIMFDILIKSIDNAKRIDASAAQVPALPPSVAFLEFASLALPCPFEHLPLRAANAVLLVSRSQGNYYDHS